MSCKKNVDISSKNVRWDSILTKLSKNTNIRISNKHNLIENVENVQLLLPKPTMSIK